MIRQLTESETTKVFAHVYAKNNLWNEYGEQLALCKIGQGIEVEVPEGTQIVGCCNGVRRNAIRRGITVQVHADRRTRRVVFKRVE